MAQPQESAGEEGPGAGGAPLQTHLRPRVSRGLAGSIASPRKWHLAGFPLHPTPVPGPGRPASVGPRLRCLQRLRQGRAEPPRAVVPGGGGGGAGGPRESPRSGRGAGARQLLGAARGGARAPGGAGSGSAAERGSLAARDTPPPPLLGKRRAPRAQRSPWPPRRRRERPGDPVPGPGRAQSRRRRRSCGARSPGPCGRCSFCCRWCCHRCCCSADAAPRRPRQVSGTRAPEAARRRRRMGGSPRGARSRWGNPRGADRSGGNGVSLAGGVGGEPGSVEGLRGASMGRESAGRGPREPESRVGWWGEFRAVPGAGTWRSERSRGTASALDIAPRKEALKLPPHESEHTGAPSLPPPRRRTLQRTRPTSELLKINRGKVKARAREKAASAGHRFFPIRLNGALPGPGGRSWKQVPGLPAFQLRAAEPSHPQGTSV